MQFSNTHHTVSKRSSKVIGYVLFFAAIFALSFLVQQDLTASDNSNPEYFVSQSGLQKVVWREDVYDPDIKGSISVIKLDENYFSKISDPEKAVLGYLASTIGNECYADGSKQNVKCIILSALNLGYQCSESSKSFLKNWFRDDAVISGQVENCKPTVAGSIEKTFEEVKISTENNMIKVELKGLKLNIKENSASSWSESLSFKVDGDKVSMIERTKKQN